jgi:hypothetical protein
MAQVKITLPLLHDAQKACVAGAKRFNCVAAGEKSGKTVLGIEVLLTSPSGALNSRKPVAFISQSEAGISTARRLVARAIGPLVKRRASVRRLELVSGGVIDFICLDTTRDFFESYGLIVIDDASSVDDLAGIWNETISASLQQHRGSCWLLGGAQGKNSDFFRLWSRADSHSEWASFQFDSFANPHLPADVAAEADAVSDTEYAQRFGAEFLDVHFELTPEQKLVKPGETFIQWCERLEQSGLMVDGQKFTLSDRPTMRFIYELIPSTVEDAFGRVDVLMKSAQVGFTVAESLACIYVALRFAPAKIGMYMPSQMLAASKSSERFMPILRTIPAAYRLMVDGTASRRGDEGNILIRNLGRSRFHFLWTTGKTSTESFPLDIVSMDEVQEMAIADMEKVRERMSASKIRYTLMGSTANWPDSDIHWWYKKGTQHQFHTECPNCGESQVLDDHFPACIGYDPDAPRRLSRAGTLTGEYRYRCISCAGWIDDPQMGRWIAKSPDAEIRSVHYPQFLSPTISPRDIIEAYHNADDMKNFFNRKLGKPYTDPSQVPVNLEMLNECARVGVEYGLQWRRNGRGTFMGLDQMGSFIVAIIKERLPDGRQAVVHMEYIFRAPTKDDPEASPWDRCDELMVAYGVQCCVVETLPNYDNAKSFARRHDGRVFLAGYGNMEGDMLRWGDAPKLDTSERRTDEELRDRFTVTLDQYKCMQVSMGRFQKKLCLFPDPDGLVQEVLEKGRWRMSPVCKEYAFFHFTRTALIAEKDEEEKKFKRRVVKVGIDPHTSYANMLADVAWARAYGTNMFILPEPEKPKETSVQAVLERYTPTLSSAIQEVIQLSGTVCGRCISFDNGRCNERDGIRVRETDPGCPLFID